MIRLAILALLALAPPAAALTPAPCFYDFDKQRLLGVDEADPVDTYGVFPGKAGRTFVLWRVEVRDIVVIQKCPRGPSLIQQMPRGDAVAAETFSNMIHSPESYTLSEMGEIMARHGLGHRITRENLGRCACDFLFGAG